MRNIYLLIGMGFAFILNVNTAKAQVKEIQLIVGDSLTLGPCTGENFEYAHIDLLIKTRFPDSTASYNTETGQGFYNWYFTGDIDSRRLPCSFQRMKFRIAAIHNYPQPDGSTRTVIFGQFIDDATVLWIEINDAVRSGEVTAG